MDNSIVIIGYSGHAYVVCDIILKNDLEITGYCEQIEKEDNPFNIPYLGKESNFDFGETRVYIAIGDNSIRNTIFKNLTGKVVFGDVFHPSSEFGHLCVLGSMIMLGANAIVNPLSTISDGAIINTGAIVEHECKIGAFAHIAPGAVLAGNVTVGARSFIGANAVVKQGVIIGNDVVVGAGAVVLKDIPNNTTVVGNPARKIIK